MTHDHAMDFLHQMSSDPETRQEVVEEYKKLLQDLAAKRGFAFSDEELVEAAKELTDAAAGEVADAAVAMVTGGGMPATPGEWRFLMSPPPDDPHSGGPGIPV
jgi:hypothetical protein